jgi:hypothetical protein
MIAVVAVSAIAIVVGVSEASTGSRAPAGFGAAEQVAAAGSGTAGQAPAWGRAHQVSGLTALGRYGTSEVNSISCPAPGNCTAGGFYERHFRQQQAFVVSEVHGI